ncbi:MULTISPECIES: cytochrome C oxidase subunit IV family protein [Salegentibacter]|jgi:ABC-type Fe3+ transport system permease subunit|uniref:Cytochrome C oxidase subunit IV n=1 Tax=Salegentibacter agarivorans TaxID=345907 RepID=A0A1I2MSX3_9FLAO|nr:MULTISPECIES: cytochrome C oxidase subunit IV family protein [Salegentibacter]APS38418.1 cytochrome C oxidase subunit IV [Salegentibacter sp. T436]SFF94000.1 Cytochrome C oxidase subunit IV [Salegentibacter agarivorans]|tara:strand:+ start:310 stop:672 length:363 start_codon:yes stop_codon:yes gene_type:complete
MAHGTAHHHESNTKKIWTVFVILSIVTLIEVVLGIFKPEFLTRTSFLSMSLLNWIFIILTIYKAYYIAWSFMHLEGETKGLRRAIVWTSVFLISYLIFILLTEGDYIYEVFKSNHVAWDF